MIELGYISIWLAFCIIQYLRFRASKRRMEREQIVFCDSLCAQYKTDFEVNQQINRRLGAKYAERKQQ
jgi:hypothetical protein